MNKYCLGQLRHLYFTINEEASKQQNLFPTVVETGGPKLRLPTWSGSMSGERLLPGSQTAIV